MTMQHMEELTSVEQKRTGSLGLWLKYVTGMVAAAYIVSFTVLALLRISYPFELEWVEGSTVDHVQRVLEGKPLYVAPSVDFVPAIYPPLYYHAAAAVAKVTGLGFLPLRLVSLLAALGCMVILYSFGKRETGDRFAGLMAAGLFAATYRLSGAWLDIGRVDSLFLFFLLGAIWVLRFYRTPVGFVLSAVILALSSLTKQTALLAAIPLMLFGIRMRKHGGWYFVAAYVLTTGLAVVLLNHASDGWFTFYAFEVPLGHNIIPAQILNFWLMDILRPLALACLCGWFFLLTRTWTSERENLWFYLLTGAGCFAAAWVPRIKDGNYANDLLPAYAFIALLFGLAVPSLWRWGKKVVEALPVEFPERNRVLRWAPVFFYGALVFQFATLYYKPWEQIPSDADRAAGNALIRSIRQFPGEVWVGHHGYLGYLAGKRPYATALPIYDVLRARNPHAKSLLLDSIEAAFKAHRFDAVFVDNDHFIDICDRSDYVRKAGVFPDPAVFWPVSGVPNRPLRVYVPAPEPSKTP